MIYTLADDMLTKAESIFQKIASTLPEVKKDTISGTPCLTASNGEAVALLREDKMVFRLDSDFTSMALSLEGASAFDPPFDLPKTGWVAIPLQHAELWESLATTALISVQPI